MRAKTRLDWQIPDPRHMEMPQFIEVRNTIRAQVIKLVEEIKSA